MAKNIASQVSKNSILKISHTQFISAFFFPSRTKRETHKQLRDDHSLDSSKLLHGYEIWNYIDSVMLNLFQHLSFCAQKRTERSRNKFGMTKISSDATRPDSSNNDVPKVYIIAGEASGDKIGSNLINEITKQNPSAHFYGIGGEQMLSRGLNPLFPMERISYMGFFDILLNILELKSLINKTILDIKEKNPDIVITIDSPGFCYRVVKGLRSSGYKGKIMHIVSPSVWAYKPGRAKKFAAVYDHLLALLPFEPPFFEKEGLNTTYIGHPVFEQSFGEENNFRQRYDIKEDEKLILITPGSRRGELKRHLPDFINALNKLASTNSFTSCFALVNNKELVMEYLKNASFRYIIVDNEDKLASYSAADIALAKSGTNTLEIAASKTPMIVAYKVDLFSYIVIKTLIKIKYASLINIIANKEILPEFLQSNCNKDSLCKAMKELLDDKKAREKQVKEAGKILKLMGYGSKEKPSRIAANAVLGVIAN